MPTDRTMTLYHVTPEVNWWSIHVYGLQPERSLGARQELWLCSGSNIRWAIKHLAKHHGLPECGFVVFKVTVRRSWLRRTGKRGVWRCSHEICPCRILDDEVSGSWME